MFIYMLIIHMFIFSFLSFIFFIYLYIMKKVLYFSFEILVYSTMKIELLMVLDWISCLFLFVVLQISMMVFLYSVEYLYNDLKYNQFNMLVIMFVISMILLILMPNYISMLIGWDGLGLVSYCLVIFYQGKLSFNSGMITIMLNRFGDVMILLSIGANLMFGSWNFMFLDSNLDKLMMIFLLIIFFTKSAQIPFSVWLPKAMAAPTPVSSLVHSSTLVTAGVYIMIRVNYMINDYLLMFIMLISVMTMLMSGLVACFENDFKKVIAYSTLSQLSVMFFCLCLRQEEISMFHLTIHAMFKSMLFMCAGCLIHSSLGSQDIRFISGFFSFSSPLIMVIFNSSIFSLCGVPFMSGFYSKDLILEMFMMNLFNKFIFLVLFSSMGLTVVYSFRMMYYSFILPLKLKIMSNMIIWSSQMYYSMFILFIYSHVSGSILSWILFSGKNEIFLLNWLKLMIYYFMILGIMVNYFFYKMKYYYYNNLMLLWKFNLLMWFFMDFYKILFKLMMLCMNFYMFIFEWGILLYLVNIKLKSKVWIYEIMSKHFFYLIMLILLMFIYILFF